MAPEWTQNWTIYEAASILLHDCPEYSMELPYDRCPAGQRLDTVWDTLTPGCRSMLQMRRDDF